MLEKPAAEGVRVVGKTVNHADVRKYNTVFRTDTNPHSINHCKPADGVHAE
jgi:hypothetical protein